MVPVAPGSCSRIWGMASVSTLLTTLSMVASTRRQRGAGSWPGSSSGAGYGK